MKEYKKTEAQRHSARERDRKRETKTPTLKIRATPDFIERLNYAAKLKNQTRVALILSILSDWLDANYL